MNMLSTILKAVVVAGAATALTMAPASAAVIDQDQVNASVSGNRLTGYVNWTSFYGGSGQVTIYNDMSDGACATAQQRVYRGGAWSGWTDIARVCTIPSYTAGVYVVSNNQPVQYWQFRLHDAYSDWVYDTNSPGGA